MQRKEFLAKSSKGIPKHIAFYDNYKTDSSAGDRMC